MNTRRLAQLLLICITSIISLAQLAADDWRMWGGSGHRNNVSDGGFRLGEWDVGKFDRKTKLWSDQKNIKWTVPLGTQTYTSPIVADGRVFIGTNNYSGYLKRYPYTVDLGCLLCFRESDGKFLWQHSNEKLPTGRVHDWPMQGICSTPLVEGDRLWYVSNRGDVVCLDTNGFHDGEDDGPLVHEWAKLFEIDITLQAALDRGEVSDRWRGLLAKAGHELTGRIGVVMHLVKKDWIICKWESVKGRRAQVPLFRIEADGSLLRCYRVDPQNADSPTMQLFSVRNDLLPSLKNGSIGPELREQFESAGLALPEGTRLNTDEPERTWSCSWQQRGHPRDVRLVNEHGRLKAALRLTPHDADEADVVWRYDMMKELGVSQHNIANCSPAAWGNVLFICTSNGVDESHSNIPNVDAPSFIALDKRSGRLLWSDASPGKSILHGQWSSPAVAVLGGVPQVIFPGGDGWVYSFRADRWNEKEQRPILLWKFDANPKESKWILGGRGTRNNIVAMPVVCDGLVYITVGQDPEHGEGDGHLWCIDPTGRGDVSSELAMRKVRGMHEPIPHRRLQAVDPSQGEVAVANPNSAVVWHYDHGKLTRDREAAFERTFHRCIANPVVKDGLLMVADFSGLFHCLDAKTGKVHWTYDVYAFCWSSPLVIGDQVLISDEDGDVTVFKLSADADAAEPLREHYVDNSVYSTPVVANNTLYLANRSCLFAIALTVEPDDN